MKNFFLKHCRLYRVLIHKLFGKYEVEWLNIPSSIYGDFSVHYLGFDEVGNVQKGFHSLVDALRNRGGLGLTVLYDKY